jgi:hypothetical protein
MKLLTYLTCFALSCLAMGHSPERESLFQEDCKAVEAKVVVSEDPDGTHTATVEISRGNKSTAQILFCAKDGKVLNVDKFKVNSLKKMRAGEYFCVVTNAGACSKKITFTIE